MEKVGCDEFEPFFVFFRVEFSESLVDFVLFRVEFSGDMVDFRLLFVTKF